MTKTLKIVFIALTVLLLGIVATLIFTTSDEVSNFQECLDEGYDIQETEPRVCVTDDGIRFVDPQDTPSSNQSSQSTQPNGTNQPQSDRNESEEEVIISVYFSEASTSDEDFSHTVAVNRETRRIDVGTFALEQLIAGPTDSEQQEGLYSPLAGKLEGESNCNENDFSLVVEGGVAKAQFCRNILTAGIGDDARIRSTINDTLMQFSTVDEVIILNKDGSCFADASDQNECLN